MAFPTIAPPSKIDEEIANNTISTVFDGGYTQTRERNTRDNATFKVDYVLLTLTDKNLLYDHFKSVRGSTPFDWTNVDNGITYTVRYKSPPKIPSEATMPNRYNISIELEQV